ncbi:MAG: cob(I)yrinic acid a,c-diamide adenosyltransferase [Pseudomonadota bacterium]
MIKGYVQVYTGDGKGKTTAAFGLALRAAGAGLKVFIAQFVKGGDNPYNEINACLRFSDLIAVKQYGRGCFIGKEPHADDVRMAHEGLQDIRQAVISNIYDMVILDEANIAVHYGLITVEKLLEIIKVKRDGIELVITGRYAHPLIIEKADLVTEMIEVKHYFSHGVMARDGIER